MTSPQPQPPDSPDPPARSGPPDVFLDQVSALGVAFDEGDVDRLGLFLAMLLEANKQFNLTSITDIEKAWTRHVFDSLTLVPYVQQSAAKRVMDVGSGGGLPGIPLAITCSQMRFTLLEATGKKARFLESVVAALGLDRVHVVNDRAETIAHDRKHHREQYELVIARAVGRLPILLELTVPFATIGGHVLAIKGERAEEEVAEAKPALHLLHCAVVETTRTPTGTIIVIEKLRKTPRIYPRRPGEPKRTPLGVPRS